MIIIMTVSRMRERESFFHSESTRTSTVMRNLFPWVFFSSFHLGWIKEFGVRRSLHRELSKRCTHSSTAESYSDLSLFFFFLPHAPFFQAFVFVTLVLPLYFPLLFFYRPPLLSRSPYYICSPMLPLFPSLWFLSPYYHFHSLLLFYYFSPFFLPPSTAQDVDKIDSSCSRWHSNLASTLK